MSSFMRTTSLGWLGLGFGFALTAAVIGLTYRGRSREVRKAITVNRPLEEVERAFRDFEGAGKLRGASVRFVPAPGDRGTEIHVDLGLAPGDSAVGQALDQLAGEAPEQQVARELYRFKQFVETGEIVQSDATLRPGRHPARPDSEMPPLREVPRRALSERAASEGGGL